MPYINVAVSGTPNAVLATRLAQRITALTTTHLQKDPVVTAVSITFIAHENWFIGAQSLVNLNTNSFGWISRSQTEPIPRCNWRPTWAPFSLR